MKLTKEERRQRREAFRQMKPAHKLEYLWTYYKLPIGAAVVALAVLGSLLWHRLTYREPCLYVALVNVNVGSELEQTLTTAFQQSNALEGEVALYEGLVFTDDPSGETYQYMYASRIKLIAAVEAGELDVVLMNAYAYHLLSEEGYLMDLSGLDLRGALSDAISDLSLLERSGMDGAVYAGVIANTPRAEQAAAYLRYLQGDVALLSIC